METPRTIREALHQGDHIIQVDLKDAYDHLAVRKKYRKYLRFAVNGTVYQWRACPFGLNIAPRVFTKTMAPILKLLRKCRIPIHAYLDDWIARIQKPDPGQGLRTAEAIASLLRLLGWIINYEKSWLFTRQQILYIGLDWDLKAAIVRPGAQKMNNLRKRVKIARPGKKLTARQLASLTGTIKWMAPYVPYGKRHLRALQHKIKTKWSQSRDGWKKQLTSDRTLHSLLLWWTRPTNVRAGVPLHPQTPSMNIFTDASDSAWGGKLWDLKTREDWTPRWKRKHINLRELEAVRRSLVTFTEHVKNKSVMVHCDNSTAVACIRRQGSLRSLPLNNLTSKILRWTEENNITLNITHIQGYR